ncbi:hypothetical protein PsYK624_102530 [Phanerochaete sordida]|uniref:Uncharacterized protein n=1 Tax=Phanerochaete sordida TaxID=48140 RepID=A0A9P3GFS6_9APHY|nr:hypothetical protein PsYK624_102530 [Phanerochaete sordida]
MAALMMLRGHPRVEFMSGRIPSLAYGFLIGDANMEHFAHYYFKKRAMTTKPDRLKSVMKGIALSACELIPTYLVDARRSIPAVRREAVVVEKADGSLSRLLVLRDNASRANLEVDTSPEDLQFIREFLNIPHDVEPEWYDVPESFWPKWGA